MVHCLFWLFTIESYSLVEMVKLNGELLQRYLLKVSKRIVVDIKNVVTMEKVKIYVLCFVFVMLSCLLSAVLWSPAGRGLTSCMWCFRYFCHFPMWCPGTSVVLDCINSWSLPSYILTLKTSTFFFKCKKLEIDFVSKWKIYPCWFQYVEI